jgi:hypothetical protein
MACGFALGHEDGPNQIVAGEFRFGRQCARPHVAPIAPNPRRVLWVMAEKEISDIEVETYNLGEGRHKQVGYLRKIMREQSVTEYQLAEFARDKLGFDTPPEGLDSLTKYQASSLIDALTKQVQG